jgi:hypothetical protein
VCSVKWSCCADARWSLRLTRTSSSRIVSGTTVRATARVSTGVCWRQDRGEPGTGQNFHGIGARGPLEPLLPSGGPLPHRKPFWPLVSRSVASGADLLDRLEPPPVGWTRLERPRHRAVSRNARPHCAIYFWELRASTANPIVATQARIDRPVDKRRASHPLPLRARRGLRRDRDSAVAGVVRAVRLLTPKRCRCVSCDSRGSRASRSRVASSPKSRVRGLRCLLGG